MNTLLYTSEVTTCPNCGENMYDGVCQDFKFCGYGHDIDCGIENYGKKTLKPNKEIAKTKEEVEKSLKKTGNKNNVLVRNCHIFGKQNTFFDPIKSKIGEYKAEIVLSFKDKFYDKNKFRYRINLNYKIFEQDSGYGRDSTRSVFQKNIKISGVEEKLPNGWKNGYLDYKKILPTICDILNNYEFRFNGKKWVAEKIKFSHIREIRLV